MTLPNLIKPAKFLVDGHWFTRSRYSVVLRENPNCTFMENIERDRNVFMTKLTMDLFAEIRNIGKLIDQVVICSDYSSWRKNINFTKAPWDKPLLPGEDPNSYKSQRVKSSEVNWNEVNRCFSDWALLMEKHFNIPYIKSYLAEGDDLMCLISSIYNNAGHNVIVFSTDGDMGQLARVNENGSWTACYKKKVGNAKYGTKNENHLIARMELIDEINNGTGPEFDIFSGNPNIDSSNDLFKSFFQQFIDIKPAGFLLEKIIEGDLKDNVLPTMVRFTAKTQQRPKKAHIEKALGLIGLTLDTVTIDHLYQQDFIVNVLRSVHDQMMKMNELPAEYMEYYINKFVENRKMLYLSDREIPMNVLSEAKKLIMSKAKLFGEKTNILEQGHYNNCLVTMEIKEIQQHTLHTTDPFAGLNFENN